MLIRKILFTGAVLSLSMAFVDYAKAETTNAMIQDHYQNVLVKNPYSVQICNEGNGKTEIENLLEGAIVGGAIGNNLPGEDGGGAIGAIIGGILNSERNKGTRCHTEIRYQNEYVTQYSYSTIEFYYNGIRKIIRFQK